VTVTVLTSALSGPRGYAVPATTIDDENERGWMIVKLNREPIEREALNFWHES
jgi:hypothetical protein